MIIRYIRYSILLILLLMVSVDANEFVSFNGKFKISLPEGWQRMDYRTVDYVLSQSQADRNALNYEAVFSPLEGIAFTSSDYLILTVDTLGAFDNDRIDSTLKALGGVFGEGLKYAPVGDLLTDLASHEPTYDPQTKTVSILSDVTESGEIFKKSLFIMKFYEHGIANFYFYSPDSLFAESQPVFKEIVASFTTENLEAVTNTEEVKIADLEDKDDSSSSKWVPFASVAIILIIILAARKRKKVKDS